MIESRNATSIEWTRSRDRRKALERAQRRGVTPSSSVWTIESNGVPRRQFLEGAIASTSIGQSSPSTEPAVGDAPTGETVTGAVANEEHINLNPAVEL